MGVMRRFSVLFVVSVLIIGIAYPCTAVTDHNLHWGFEVGDRFHYRVSGPDYIGFPDYYVEIEGVTTIPEDVHDYYDIMTNLLSYSYYFENGTPLTYFYGSMWTALPVGNWPLVQQLLNDSQVYYEDYGFINTATEWGVRYSEDFSSITRTTTVKVSKADGALTLLQVVNDPAVGLTLTSKIVRVSSLSTPILLVGIGAAIIVAAVIGVVLFKNRRVV